MSIVNARMIFYLSGVVETFPDDAINDDPGEEEEAEEVRLDLPHLRDTLTLVEHLIAKRTFLSGQTIYGY